MTIYNFLEILFFILFFLEYNGKHTEARRMQFFKIEVFLVFFILAFRNYNVGADTPEYVWYYIGSSKYDFDEQPIGFEWFCDVLRFFCKDWRFFILVTATVSLVPFVYLVKKYAPFVTLPFMTFLLCWKQLWLLETPLKQTTAIAMFFCGYLLLFGESEHRKKVRLILGIIMCVLACLTHSTMILFAPIALILPFIKLNKRVAVITIIVSMAVSSFIIMFIPQLYDSFKEYTIAFSIFDNIGNNYIEEVNNGLETLNITAILPQSLYVLLMLGLCGEKDMNNYSMKCLVTAAVMLNLFVSFPNHPRVILYFSLIGSAFCPLDFYSTHMKGKNKVYFLVLLLLMFAFFYLHLKLCINFKPTHSWDILPYSFWFFNPMQP